MNTWQLATEIRLTGKFYDKTTDPAELTDPSAVTLYIMDPAGVIETYTYVDSDLTRSAEGVYFMDYTPTGPGTWRYKFQGEGDLIATSPDQMFGVAPSGLMPAWP